jgi:phthalate 4,5-dioxygenase
MLSAQDNELLTRVGPEAAMGRLMREFWMPACLSSELVADGAPVRLLLLGEKLIGFRDSSGKAAILDHLCPHRCASLFFGRNEQNGIRCAYHGWKFDADGNCVDMPNVPPHLQFADRVKAKAYPTREAGGLVWIYMGQRDTPPPLPAIEALTLPQEQINIRVHMRECNWLQSMEGDIDTSHFGFLHVGMVKPDQFDPADDNRWAIINRDPEYHVREMEYGAMYGAYRPAGPGRYHYRFAHFLFPCFTLTPDGNIADMIQTTFSVPMDDHHTMVFNLSWDKRSITMRHLKDGARIPGATVNTTYLPRTNDWYGRWRLVASKANDYFLDRDKQLRGESYTGIEGVGSQDQAMIESMEPIVDRTREHLAPSDRMIALTRRRLIEAAKAFRAEGQLPQTVDRPELTRSARGGSIVAPADQNWLDVYGQAIRTAVSPAKFLVLA